MSEILYEAKNLTKVYHKHTALNNASFQIGSGKIVGLLGPNGSGKTTLLKLSAGLLIPTEGEVLLLGQKPDPKTKAFVSYLPEKSYLDGEKCLDDYLKLFSDFYTDFSPEKAEKLISLFRLERKAKIRTLSKGTQEKVQLLLVMSRNAKLYLLDEPLGGVDPAARSIILKSILESFDEEASLVLSTHMLSEIEPLLDEVLFLKDGSVLIQDEAEQLREERGQSLTEIFLEEYIDETL